MAVYGMAYVHIIGKNAFIKFMGKVTNKKDSQSGYAYISPTILKSLNSNIPSMTLTQGGLVQIYRNETLYGGMNDYSGMISIASNKWAISRMYTESGKNGAWAPAAYMPNDYIIGECVGSIS